MKFKLRNKSQSKDATSEDAADVMSESMAKGSTRSSESRGLLQKVFMTKLNSVTKERKPWGGKASKPFFVPGTSYTSSTSDRPKGRKQKQQKRRKSLLRMDVPGDSSGSTGPPENDSFAFDLDAGRVNSRTTDSGRRLRGRRNSSRSALTSSTATTASAYSSSRSTASSRGNLGAGRASCFRNNPHTHSALVAEYTRVVMQEEETFAETKAEREIQRSLGLLATLGVSSVSPFFQKEGEEEEESCFHDSSLSEAAGSGSSPMVMLGHSPLPDVEAIPEAVEEGSTSYERPASAPQHIHQSTTADDDAVVSHIHCERSNQLLQHNAGATNETLMMNQQQLHHYQDHHPETSPLRNKEFAFQLIPNDHKELGMLHSDFQSIPDAISFARQCPQQTPKPIVCVETEVPGNAYAGKTIFSHPLIVEAMETHFIVVARPVSALEQQSHANGISSESQTVADNARSKMRGNYLYTRVRILDPLTGYDLVPCVDHQLSCGSLVQAMLDALSMMTVCSPSLSPSPLLPRYLSNMLEEERANILGGSSGGDVVYINNTRLLQEHHDHLAAVTTSQKSDSGLLATPLVSDLKYLHAPMVVIGMENTALGEVVFAGLEGVISTVAAWVLPKLQSTLPITATGTAGQKLREQLAHLPSRKAVICIRYDPHMLTFCALIKFAIAQHSQRKLGRPSGLTLYYHSNEEHMTAQLHTRAHYRNIMQQVDPTNPAQYYYSPSGPATTSSSNSTRTTAASHLAHETIRILPLQHEQREKDASGVHLEYETMSGDSNSSVDSSHTGVNNSANKTHPGYKVPDYDDVVEHAAAKAAAENANEKDIKFSFVLKPISYESLKLQCSKPSLRESHLRFVPLTPHQATLANRLVSEGKFHMAMKLLSPRQGMLLMHALRSGRTRGHSGSSEAGTTGETTSGANSEEKTSPTPSRSSFASLQSTSSSQGGATPRRRKSARKKRKSGTCKDLPSQSSPVNTTPLAAARQRRVSTAEIALPDRRRFPKQAPRLSLNGEAMKKAASIVAKEKPLERPPAIIETTAAPSADPSAYTRCTPSIVYEDVVDVPILEAWDAFVVYPKQSCHRDCQDDYDSDSLFLGAEDVYSEYVPASRSHSLASNLSLFTNSTADDG